MRTREPGTWFIWFAKNPTGNKRTSRTPSKCSRRTLWHLSDSSEGSTGRHSNTLISLRCSKIRFLRSWKSSFPQQDFQPMHPIRCQERRQRWFIVKELMRRLPSLSIKMTLPIPTKMESWTEWTSPATLTSTPLTLMEVMENELIPKFRGHSLVHFYYI